MGTNRGVLWEVRGEVNGGDNLPTTVEERFWVPEMGKGKERR